MRGPLRASGLALALAALSAGAFAMLPRASAGAGPHRRKPSDPASFVPPIGAPLVFDAAAGCDPRSLVIVGAYGDILLHNGAHRQGVADGFDALFAPLASSLRAPAVTYANLEGPLGGSFERDRSTIKNLLSYDERLAGALARAGIDVVSVANNHALDRGDAGVRQTLDVLDAAGVAGFGAAQRAYAVTRAGDVSIAWVACTEWTNEPDPQRLVLDCRRDHDAVIALVKTLAAENDVVIATPHGGTGGDLADGVTRRFHRELVGAGALVVIGNHPHRAQAWEKVAAPDGREAFVSTCSGAGMTAFRDGGARVSALLLVGLSRDAGGAGVVRVRFVRYAPFEWRRDGARYGFVLPASERMRARLHRVWSAANEQDPAAGLPGCSAAQ